MKFIDLVGMAVEALLRRRARTLLTLFGVTLAACLLVLSLAVGLGLRDAIERQFADGGAILNVTVMAKYATTEEQIAAEANNVDGEMSDARRERLQQALSERRPSKPVDPKLPLTFDRLDELRRLPHVETVWPDLMWHNRVEFGDHVETGWTVCVPTGQETVDRLIVAGRGLQDGDDKAVLIHEFHAWDWGYRNEADVSRLLGQKVTLENIQRQQHVARFLLGFDHSVDPQELAALEDAVDRLPEFIQDLPLSDPAKAALKKALTRSGTAQDEESITIRDDFEIVGVYRSQTDADGNEYPHSAWRFRSSSAVIPVSAGERLLAQHPVYRDYGVSSAVLQVDRKEHVRAVVDRLDELGFENYSMVAFVERLIFHVSLIIAALTGFATAALFVAAVGITNTMVMSVLERTREIGVLKALGATGGQILSLFLIEGFLLGFAGGLAGVLCGWAASQGLDSWVHGVVTNELGREVESSVFVFPLWLSAAVPAACALTTMLASVYPARKAAVVNPVHALRHE